MLAHCIVYTLPFKTPRKGSNKGKTFNTNKEPPGRSGAQNNSHARPNAIKPIKEAEAVYRK